MNILKKSNFMKKILKSINDYTLRSSLLTKHSKLIKINQNANNYE